MAHTRAPTTEHLQENVAYTLSVADDPAQDTGLEITARSTLRDVPCAACRTQRAEMTGLPTAREGSARRLGWNASAMPTVKAHTAIGTFG